jgi:hypothetical protein
VIIGLHGNKGVGKDTAGQFLIDTYEFQKVAFADPLKEAVAALFDITREEVDQFKEFEYTVQVSPGVKSLSWREFLQRFGTEMGREVFGRDFWVDLWEDYLYQNSIHEDNIVATDVRFKNEAEKIQHMGGIIVRIVRPGYEPDGHASEEPLPDLLVDVEVNNNGSLEDFQVDMFELYKEAIRRQEGV